MSQNQQEEFQQGHVRKVLHLFARNQSCEQEMEAEMLPDTSNANKN